MKKFAILTIIALMTIISCDTENTGGKKPGKFAVQADSSRSVMARNLTSIGPYPINSSRTIYFYLKNIGDFPITDIELSLGKHDSDFEPIKNQDFVIFPTKINSLSPSSGSSVDTFIELNVNHGDIIGLLGQKNVIKNGVEGVKIRITGMTTDSDDKAISISLDVNVDMDIKVASFDIVYGDDNTVATKYRYNFPGSAYIGYLIPLSNFNKVRLHNIGNVNLYVKMSRNSGGNWEDANYWEEVLPNTYSELFTSFYNWDAYYFIIDTRGIAFDNNGNNDFYFRAGTSIIQSRHNNTAGSQQLIIYPDY